MSFSTVVVLLALVLLEETAVEVAGAKFKNGQCVEDNVNTAGELAIRVLDSEKLLTSVVCSGCTERCVLDKPPDYDASQLKCKFVPFDTDTATKTPDTARIDTFTIVVGSIVSCILIFAAVTSFLCVRQWEDSDGLMTSRVQTNCAVAVTSECANASKSDQRRDSGSSSDGTVYDEPWDSTLVDRLWTFYSEKYPDSAVEHK